MENGAEKKIKSFVPLYSLLSLCEIKTIMVNPKNLNNKKYNK